MAPVDLNKNRESILKAHKEVSNPNSKTNWALYGYEGQTDILKVLSTGDGGLEELQEDLSSGKILYAYVKIIDPNTKLPKFVFINWQGEGVPEQKKGGCASHVRDVQNVLRGAHVTINARTEDDIDEETVVQKVSKASGANYSFHKEQQKPQPAITPVGSVYEKVRPQIEIKPDIREKFWENSEKEEKQRILLEKQRLAQEKTKLEKDAKEREAKETQAREQREAERINKIREIKEAEKQALASDKYADRSHWDENDARRDEEERAKRSDQMRKDRAAEAKALVSGKTTGVRSVFEQKPTSQFDQENRAPPPSRKLKQPTFLDNEASEATERKQPIQLPKDSSCSPAGSPPARAPAPRTPASAPAPRAPAAPRPPSPTEQTFEEPEDTYDDAASLQKHDIPVSGPHVRNLLSEGLPPRPPSDDEQQDWQDDDDTATAAAPVKCAVAERQPEEELYNDTGDVTASYTAQQENEELYEDTTSAAEPLSVRAKALYDYQAAEENEITFDPDDIISDIEMIDEGWWIGSTADGQRGMFPSNYVQLF